ncbi:MAG: hypothetical protein RL518_216 [Pseudomonadota bacterium]
MVNEDSEKNPALANAAPGSKARIGPFLDGRSSDTIALIDGRQVRSEGSVGAAVQTGFERQLRAAGVRVSLLQAPTIEGEIVDWKARVSPDFPASQVVANAKVKVTIKGPKSEVLYRATYSGEANKTHPVLGESDIQATLGTAMATALEAAVKDDGFMRQLVVR